ncbi:MAG: potassium/proton antiporter [Tissierellia bacterium]|nr:potassium/proton antiporter [Tissierellia bacterium]
MEVLLVSIVIILAVLANKISDKIGLPSLLLFIVLGIIFGMTGLFDNKFSNFVVGEKIASISLIAIMFYGGFGTNWKMARPVARESIILSTLGVFFTAVFITIFCTYILKFDIRESFLLGSVVASTDAASVFSILRSKNLNLKYNSASLLEVESGSNDPMAYMLTIVALSLITGSEVSVFRLIFTQFFFGIVNGVIMSYVLMFILRRNSFEQDGFLTIFVFAITLFTYAITNQLNGNGYLAVYIFGIIIGNKDFQGKRDLVHFFDGFTGLMQIAVFFLMGLLSSMDQLIASFGVAAIIMIFMTIVARPLAVFGLLAPFRSPLNQKIVVSFAGLRGAAAIAFAMMVVMSDAVISMDIFHIVFGICLLSSFVQGSFLPWISKKYDMIDDTDTVLKTFNDYTEEGELNFIKVLVDEKSKQVGRTVGDLDFELNNLLIPMINRNGTPIIPKGDTEILEGDIIVLSGEAYTDRTGSELKEYIITNDDPWANKQIKDINISNRELVVIIRRSDGEIVVPDGMTTIYPNDSVIVSNI